MIYLLQVKNMKSQQQIKDIYSIIPYILTCNEHKLIQKKNLLYMLRSRFLCYPSARLLHGKETKTKVTLLPSLVCQEFNYDKKPRCRHQILSCLRRHLTLTNVVLVWQKPKTYETQNSINIRYLFATTTNVVHMNKLSANI